MNSFLLVYDQKLGELIRPIAAFNESEGDAALRRRFELEREYRGQKDVEIVVLGAESEAAIRKTHGRYFKTVSELLEDMQSTLRELHPAS